jgi:tRNA (guanine-N7-)-methyltransferase
MTAQTTHPARAVRSFVRREGRMTNAQKRALADLWSFYGIDEHAALLGSALFSQPRELTLEIGFGDGETLVNLAKQRPEAGFIGIDPHRPGAGRMLLQLQREGIENVRVIIGDAVELLPRLLGPASLSCVLVLFPDPWPKKRHHKRRLLNTLFLQMLSTKLKPGGHLHVATDWSEYAEEILAAIDTISYFRNNTGRLQFANRPDWRPVTKYERRGLKLGHDVFDIAATRI